MLSTFENASKAVTFLFRDPLRRQRLFIEGRRHEIGFGEVNRLAWGQDKNSLFKPSRVAMMRTYHCFWLLFWAGQPHQSFLTPLPKRTSGFPEKEKVLVLSGNSRRDLHRSKRSWMWNQFFLLEEYTGTDYQYVGKVRLFHMHLHFTFRSTGKPRAASR